MDIVKIREALASLLFNYDAYEDDLPDDFNFNKGNMGVSYIIGNVMDGGYKNSLALEVRITSLQNYKTKAQRLAQEIDLLINRATLNGNSIIVKQNAWYINHVDESDKNNIIMQYFIHNYI